MNHKNAFVVFFILIALMGCQQRTTRSANAKVVRDYFNREIEIPATINSIVPLYYVQAEIISAIGAKNKIKGIGKIDKNSSPFISTYFPTLLDLPQVGNRGNINYEKLVSLKPDIIFTGAEQQTVDKIEQLGYRAIATYPRDLNEICDEILFYGTILNRAEQSKKLQHFYMEQIERIRDISKNIPPNEKLKVYYIRTDALTSLGGNTQGEIIDLIGGKLVTDGLGDNSTSLQLSIEDIYKYNPDVIIIRDRALVTPADLYKDQRWKNVNAVKNKKIFQEHYGWTEFRLESIFGIIEKAKWLHPKLFKELNASEEYIKFIKLVKQNSE